jgi:peptidyl-prolyl cis-trans isomerase C
MLRRDSLAARWSATLLLLSTPAVFAADAKPIARVGSESVSADALSWRIAKIPDFQRAALGDSPSKLKRQVLDTFVIPDLLYSQEAERLKLGERPTVRNRQREVLRAAMDHELRQEARAKTPVTTEDIRAYFEANRSRFETPRRVHIWRILSDDEALAKKVIADAKGVDGIQRWSQYAREGSLDKATHLRNGDLGFVHPDGDTDTPTLRVDPALFAAADQLKDGELAAEPIKEGLHWAVIWRRGSMKAINRSLEQEQGSIRQVLERQRVEQARDALLGELRSKYVSALNEAALENVRFDGDGLPVHDAALPPGHAAAAGSSVPEPGERGTR